MNNLARKINCPVCYRMLAKGQTVNGVELLYIAHRGYHMLAERALVQCPACSSAISLTPAGAVPTGLALPSEPDHG